MIRTRNAIAAAVVTLTLVMFSVNPVAGGERYAMPAEPGTSDSTGCYISNGDNDLIFSSPPIDSRNTIDGVYDLLDKVYGVDRIYWRAAQVREIMYHCQVRPEHFHHRDLWKWVDSLYQDCGLDRYGVDAAHARGMTVWGIAALFDHGGQAVVDSSNGSGPSPVESFIRLEHPEWIPADRFGIRRMSGSICFAYPEARKALIDMQVKLATSADYDGLMFHTYVEQMAMRHDDEFGFNEPIVKEFQKRYAVDILTEAYDKEALANLRGEYLTQYFRELKSALAAHNVKLGVFINPAEPEKPQRWLADTSVMCSGNVTIDWPRYISEGIMDEIMVYCGGDVYPVIEQVLAQTQGTDIAVSTLHSARFPEDKKHLAEKRVRRVLAGGYKGIEWGYFEDQPVSALDGDDFIARLTVLQQMADGRTELDLSKIIAATRDRHVMVRRRAVAVLGELKQSTPDVIAALEQRLCDEENTVRSYAFNVLAMLGSCSSFDKMFTMLAEHHNALTDFAAVSGLANSPQSCTDDLIKALSHCSEAVRSVGTAALGGGHLRPGAIEALLRARNDVVAETRWNVIKALSRFDTPEIHAALYGMLDDPHPTVHNMAALKLSMAIQAGKKMPEGLREKTLQRLQEIFSRYNRDNAATDNEWAWRCIGDALNRIAPEGPVLLAGFLNQNDDLVLAEHAWEALYVKQFPFWKYPVTAQDEADAAYTKHPRLR